MYLRHGFPLFFAVFYCCCLFKTKIFKDIGKLDERFFAYYEDVDFSLRLKKNGYKIGFTSNR